MAGAVAERNEADWRCHRLANFAKDQMVLVAPITGGLLKSTNGGTTWAAIASAAGLRILDIEPSPNFAKDMIVYAGSVQSGLLRSKDGGNTFTKMAAFPDVFVSANWISPNFAKDQILFAAGYHGIYKSTTRGSALRTYTAEPARIEDGRNVTSITDQQPQHHLHGILNTQVTNVPQASANSYMITSESQDSATLQFMGTGLRWLSWTGPLQGTATVQLDGATPGTVNLLARPTYGSRTSMNSMASPAATTPSQ